MRFARVALFVGLALLTNRVVVAQALSEDQFVIVPLRVHVLTGPDLELADCKLTDADVAAVIRNINAIWNKAGIHFGVESVLREPAEQRERFRLTTEGRGGNVNTSQLKMLLPRRSRTFDGLHVYFFHSLPFNSVHAGDDIVLAQEGAQVQNVPGGSDDALARVTAHVLGNALALPNRDEPQNLMGGATSGVALNLSQSETAREVALTVRGSATAAGLRKAAQAAEARNDAVTARRLRAWLREAAAALEAAAKEAKTKAASPRTQNPDQFLIIPLRVHVMTARDIELANCKLTDAELARVIGHINDIWHPAGIHFGVESIIREDVEQRERFRDRAEINGGEAGEEEIRMLMPRATRGGDVVHVYFFHQLPYNSNYLGDDIVLAQEGARLRQVVGGGDDPVARVTAHALGNLLGLVDDAEPRNLMARGTSGVILDENQREAARKVARTIRGVATASEVRKAAMTAKSRSDAATLRRLQSWLDEIPGRATAEAQPRPNTRTPAP